MKKNSGGKRGSSDKKSARKSGKKTRLTLTDREWGGIKRHSIKAVSHLKVYAAIIL